MTLSLAQNPDKALNLAGRVISRPGPYRPILWAGAEDLDGLDEAFVNHGCYHAAGTFVIAASKP